MLFVTRSSRNLFKKGIWWLIDLFFDFINLRHTSYLFRHSTFEFVDMTYRSPEFVFVWVCAVTLYNTFENVRWFMSVLSFEVSRLIWKVIKINQCCQDCDDVTSVFISGIEWRAKGCGFDYFGLRGGKWVRWNRPGGIPWVSSDGGRREWAPGNILLIPVSSVTTRVGSLVPLAVSSSPLRARISWPAC